MVWLIFYSAISLIVFLACLFVVSTTDDPEIIKWNPIVQFIMAVFVALLWPIMILVGFLLKEK